MPKLISQYDEPFGDSSAIPTWYVAQHTKEHVTVALSGDGGDELFAGYQRYKAVNLGNWLDCLGPLKNFFGLSVWQKLPNSSRQKSFFRRVRRFTEAAAMPAARRYMQWISIFNEARRAALYTEDFMQKLDSDPFDFLQHAWQKSQSRHPITNASLADMVTYLPGDLNTKVDMATMAHSLECRQPFLDHRLAELSIQMPHPLKWNWGRGKQILQKTFGEKLPPEIWKRKKMGFGVPLDYWFRGELKSLISDILLSERTYSRGYFRAEEIQILVKQHLDHQFDHSARIWALLFLELWLREWVDP